MFTTNLSVMLLHAKYHKLEKIGHIFLQWPHNHQILFTYEKLRKLHRNFLHPNSDTVLNSLKLARPWKIDKGIEQIFKEIEKNCTACQKFSRALV